MATIEGVCILPGGKKEKRKIIFDASIQSIENADGNADVICSDSQIIFPGFVDVHVHAREDRTKKWNYKEDFKSAGEAALRGGVTAFMEMPNTPEPTVTEELVKSRRELARKSAVPIIIAAGIDAHSSPIEGVSNYKVFLTKSVGELYFDDYKKLEGQVARYQGVQLHVHCEDHHTIEHDASRPAIAEHIAVRHAIEIIRRNGLRAHICHVSTANAVEMIRDAKKEGLAITAEVTPHHLFFDTKNVAGFKRASFIKMNPPLRTQGDREALISALRDGTIDALGTDHAPHTVEEKASTNPSGVPHLDTFGPFVSWLMEEHNFTQERIAECCAEFPARLIGLNQGEIAIGKDASFTVIDTQRPITIFADSLKTKCKWSPFEGVTFPGSVAATIIRGKIHKNE